MAEIVIMPKQGLQMTEGTIMRWLAAEGDEVVKDEPLFEMETDKLTIAIDALHSGTLLKIIRGVGEVVPITRPIAIIGQSGEDISGLLNEINGTESVGSQPLSVASAPAAEREAAEPGGRDSAASGAVNAFVTPRAKMTAEQKKVDISQVPPTGPDGLVIERDVLSFADGTKVKASPLAKKIADLNGLEVGRLTGSGSHGKVMSGDVLEALAAKAESRRPAEAEDETLIPLSGMRKVVASRMKASLTEMAQASHRISVDMTEAVKLREWFKKSGNKVSYNDLVLRCTSVALTEYPMMNSSWSEDGIVLKKSVNLGMAVAVEDGLLVPVIKNADLMRLSEIAACSAELAKRAKDHSLRPDQYSGGTFTVSNLGMFDIDDFTAIVNPPEVGILAVGKLEKKAVVMESEDGEAVVIRPMMRLSLSYDHRVVDGAPAAGFLKRIKTLLENPLLLI